VLGIRRRDAEVDQTVADELGARRKQIFAYRKPRLILEKKVEQLLLVVTAVAGASVGIYAVLPESSHKGGPATLAPTLGTATQGAAETSVAVVKSSNPARKQLEDLQSQLAQATEQLKSSQGRVGQLEAQLKEVPSSADLDNARKQVDDLRSQLSTVMAIAEKPKKVETTALKNTSPVTRATTVVASASDQDYVLERPGEASTEQPLDPEGIKGLSLSGSPSARPTAPAPSGGLAPAAGPAAVPPAPARPPSERPPSSTDISLILARGDSLFGVGDIASARLFCERVADAGDGQAALRLGETYDPAFLERAQLRVQGDRAQGVFWYRRARDLGASEAEILLKGAQVR